MSESTTLAAEHHSDYTGAKIGMWLFLFTEVLLFGGLFLLYAVYRTENPKEFHKAAMELNTLIGTFNTIILLTSSLTVVLSIHAAQHGKRDIAKAMLAATIVLGVAFLVNKYFEWSAKIGHGIYPGSPDLLALGKGENVFFALYFIMTGLHAIHVLVGIVILAVMGRSIANKPCVEIDMEGIHLEKILGGRVAIHGADGRELWKSDPIDGSVERVTISVKYDPSAGRVNPQDFIGLENAGLYWHLVDIIWIFLFPLFYLIS